MLLLFMLTHKHVYRQLGPLLSLICPPSIFNPLPERRPFILCTRMHTHTHCMLVIRGVQFIHGIALPCIMITHCMFLLWHTIDMPILMILLYFIDWLHAGIRTVRVFLVCVEGIGIQSVHKDILGNVFMPNFILMVHVYLLIHTCKVWGTVSILNIHTILQHCMFRH